jgi:hypothetical protein
MAEWVEGVWVGGWRSVVMTNMRMLRIGRTVMVDVLYKLIPRHGHRGGTQAGTAKGGLNWVCQTDGPRLPQRLE